MPADIVLQGVRVHNLKGVDVTIPTRKLVVITGVSFTAATLTVKRKRGWCDHAGILPLDVSQAGVSTSVPGRGPPST